MNVQSEDDDFDKAMILVLAVSVNGVALAGEMGSGADNVLQLTVSKVVVK